MPVRLPESLQIGSVQVCPARVRVLAPPEIERKLELTFWLALSSSALISIDIWEKANGSVAQTLSKNEPNL